MEPDFIAIVAMPITFPPSTDSMQTRVVQIRVIDDMFVENDEILRSAISLSTVDSGIILDPGQADIIIRNDDGIYTKIL